MNEWEIILNGKEFLRTFKTAAQVREGDFLFIGGSTLYKIVFMAGSKMAVMEESAASLFHSEEKSRIHFVKE